MVKPALLAERDKAIPSRRRSAGKAMATSALRLGRLAPPQSPATAASPARKAVGTTGIARQATAQVS